MADRVIVSRHPAAIAFIARHLHPDWHAPGREGDVLVWRPVGLEPADPDFDKVYDSIHVYAEATVEDVRGKVVYGNLPNHLACEAREVWSIEFRGTPPRGQEYSLEAMDGAGARLARYVVLNEAGVARLGEAAHSDGYWTRNGWLLLDAARTDNPMFANFEEKK